MVKLQPLFLGLFGDKEPSVLALKKLLSNNKDIELVYLSKNKFGVYFQIMLNSKTIIILNTTNNTPLQVNTFMWGQLRSNYENIGKKLAGLPVIVLGMDKHFLKKSEGKVFRDFPAHHQYLTKPLNLYKFVKSLNELSSVDSSSLPVINGDAPESVVNALEHDLRDISKKFDYNGSDQEIKDGFASVIADFRNYQLLQKDKRKVKKLEKEVERLKKQIITIKGKLWKKKFSS